ncbi:MAG TPA: ABC transporter permease [Aggregatilineales bacterium]|nr:ABC transporter permease [Aggregatilineales bacterium]
MTSYSSASSTPSGGRGISSNVILLALAGLFALLLAQQIAAGWLALGERINIPRTDFNLTEILVMVIAGVWGLFTLFSALTLPDRDTGIRTFFDDNGPMPSGLRYIAVNFGLLGGICLLIAVQVLTGWLPLGERVNILRSNLNVVEWGTILGCVLWAGLALRTALGFFNRERPAWSWGQWMLLLMVLGGLILLMSGIFDIPDTIGRGVSVLANLSTLLLLIAPGVLIVLSCLAMYRHLTNDYGDVRSTKAISGTLAERARARDVRSRRVPAAQAIRNRLAASPGAGAIIGFVALFMFFSVASDFFLQGNSLAGALTNNITRGIVAIGVTMLMISGEFDLSVGSVLGIGGLTFLGLITGQFPRGITPLDPFLALIVTLLLCGFLGFINGFLLVRTGIPSFIVTLATLLMYRGLPLTVIVGGQTIRYVDFSNQPPVVAINRFVVMAIIALGLVALAFVGRALLSGQWSGIQKRRSGYAEDTGDFKALALGASTLNFIVTSVIFAALAIALVLSLVDQIGLLGQSPNLLVSFFDLANGRIANIGPLEIPREINLRLGVIWWMILVIIFQFILTQTRYGNATYAVGGNAGAARAQGINVNRVRITNYIILAMLVGVASIIDASRLQSIDALRGTGLELEVIAATVIGGALLTGGYGSIIGALLGVFIFGMMQTGLVLIGIDARLFDAVIGLIILLAVVINNWSRRIRT